MEYPDRVEAVHTNMIQAPPPPDVDDFTVMLDKRELSDLQETREFRETGFAYFDFHATAPQTAAYGLTDSPAGLAGWILGFTRGATAVPTSRRVSSAFDCSITLASTG